MVLGALVSIGASRRPRARRAGVVVLLLVLAVLAGCGQTPSRWAPADHVVREGDTLYSIAHANHLDYRVVARWNGIRPPYVIRPGERIRLTPPPGGAPASMRKPAPAPQPEPEPRPDRPPAEAERAPASPTPGPDTARERARIRWVWPTEGRLVRDFRNGDPARKGLDIEGREGQPVRSAAAGKVVYSGSGLVGYGRLIIVKHSPAYLSAYGHNRRLLVKEGQRVDTGEKIAEMGRADADSAMLHFEIRRNGDPVDPERYLPDR